jgi:hypothetical protein
LCAKETGVAIGVGALIVGVGSAAITAGVNSHPDTVSAAAPNRQIAISH